MRQRSEIIQERSIVHCWGGAGGKKKKKLRASRGVFAWKMYPWEGGRMQGLTRRSILRGRRGFLEGE